MLVFVSGTVSLILLFAMRKFNPKLPAEMIVIAFIFVSVYLLGWQEKGVQVVSNLGPMPVLGVVLHLPQVPLADWQFYLTSGLAVALLSIMEALSVSKSVALARGEKINISIELVGQGLASLIGGLFQSPPASGSPSRTAVSISAGTRTRFGAVFLGLWVIPVVLLLPKWLGFIPLPRLATVVIASATRIVNWKHVRLTWKKIFTTERTQPWTVTVFVLKLVVFGQINTKLAPVGFVFLKKLPQVVLKNRQPTFGQTRY